MIEIFISLKFEFVDRRGVEPRQPFWESLQSHAAHTTYAAMFRPVCPRRFG